MKIMLIQAEPPDDIQDFNFPMGYAALDSVLTKHGHEVEMLFTVAYHLTEKDIAKRVKESNAQVIGIGGMFPYLQRVEMLVENIREVRPDIKIVLGGWMVTYCPELVLKKTEADFCIAGDGEIAFSKLAKCLEDNSDYSNIKGLVFEQDGQIINNGLAEHIRLEDVPMPNWEKFPMSYYLRIGWYFNSFCTGYDRVMGWAWSRGCPGKCNFCTPGHLVRYKKIDQVKEELHEIVDRLHPTFFYWMDNLTLASPSYTKNFCEMLINEKFNFRYFATGRVDRVNRDSLRLLKESGCVCILYGLETANNGILKFMNKNTTVEQVIEAVKLTKEAGIAVNLSAMFGQPMETIQDLYNTVKIIMTASDRKMPFSNNQGFYPLTTFPGSPMYYWAKEKAYIKDDEDFYNQFFKKRWINYTRYPRHIVEQVLNVANLLNTWNFHYNKTLSLEDSLFYMRASSTDKVPIRRLALRLKNRILYSRPNLERKIKRLLEAFPLLHRMALRLLGQGQAVDTDGSDLMVTKKVIDPEWDPQKQLETFIDLLVKEYFLSGGEEKVQKNEEAGRLAVLAKAFYDRGDYEGAIKYYKRVLERTSEDYGAWSALGWALQHSMRYNDALEAFKQALGRNGDDKTALRGLGWAYYQKGLFDMAVQSFTEALEYIHTHDRDLIQETCRGRGWAFFNLKRYDEAYQDFDRAIENTELDNEPILTDLHNGKSMAASAMGQTGLD